MSALFNGKPLYELRVANAMSRQLHSCRWLVLFFGQGLSQWLLLGSMPARTHRIGRAAQPPASSA
jgi:hypothetical protein